MGQQVYTGMDPSGFGPAGLYEFDLFEYSNGRRTTVGDDGRRCVH